MKNSVKVPKNGNINITVISKVVIYGEKMFPSIFHFVGNSIIYLYSN